MFILSDRWGEETLLTCCLFSDILSIVVGDKSQLYSRCLPPVIGKSPLIITELNICCQVTYGSRHEELQVPGALQAPAYLPNLLHGVLVFSSLAITKLGSNRVSFLSWKQRFGFRVHARGRVHNPRLFRVTHVMRNVNYPLCMLNILMFYFPSQLPSVAIWLLIFRH